MCLYQDFEKGGLRMPDIETINKALKLTRLLKTGNFNWRTVPEYFLKNTVVSVSYCCAIIE